MDETLTDYTPRIAALAGEDSPAAREEQAKLRLAMGDHLSDEQHTHPALGPSEIGGFPNSIYYVADININPKKYIFC